MLRIKVGCHLSYTSPGPTPAVFIVKPPPHPGLMIAREEFDLEGAAATGEYIDGLGNRCQRITLAAGPSRVRFEALALVSGEADVVREGARAIPPQELPAHLLRYTLPSRYAETDKLLAFAWETFGHLPAGWARARGVCDWVHRNVEYKRGVSLPHWSAADTISRREGVCRDRAHAVVALCRALNMPARYTVCYLPDIEVPDDGIPMDFHAYAEVWLEGGWTVFDPHDAFPRRGRVFIASGLDAADAAFATLYGNAHLLRMQVWADAVDDQERKLELPRPAPPPPPPSANWAPPAVIPATGIAIAAPAVPSPAAGLAATAV
jgi:transglutaminase-like putative cysteine protease